MSPDQDDTASLPPGLGDRMRGVVRPRRLAILVSGLATHGALLRFGAALEAHGGLSGVVLESTKRGSGIFRATAVDADRIAAALAVPGFHVDGSLSFDESGFGVAKLIVGGGDERTSSPLVGGRPNSHGGLALDEGEGAAGRTALSAPPAGLRLPAAPPSWPDLSAAEEAALVPPEARPGGAIPSRERIALSAYPFRSFSQISKFEDCVREIEGVVNVSVARLYRGALQLRVDYEGLVPLMHRLERIPDFVANRIIRPDEGTIEFVLEG